ncbi:NAD-dependent epimerase/dehydratase family protein [Coleofasciculus chthonoplastes]|uniref:NAD-dependent epimerase/dehydratase family protein n=1 Tax=Coleofasciculus chthonoplastes TaxID=64178 RepID=UPI0032F1A788
MKVAVTGATGFIGRHVLAQLYRYPVDVVALVRDSNSNIIKDFAGKVVTVDLCEPPTDLFNLLGSPDILIHLAWGGLPNYQSLHHFEQELPCQYQFLKELIQSGLSNLIVAGTCFEYGMQSGALEETLVTCPCTPYGYAKNALRCQLEYLQSQQPFKLAWARLFYMYGDGQPQTTLFSQLKSAIENRHDVFNMSGGEQLRDYLPVSEIAKILVKLALKSRNIGIVNICSGNPISIRRLVEYWIETHGWEIQLNLGYYPYPEHEPMAFWGTRRKLDRFLEEF